MFVIYFPTMPKESDGDEFSVAAFCQIVAFKLVLSIRLPKAG